MAEMLYAEVLEVAGDAGTLHLHALMLEDDYAFVESPTLAMQLLVQPWQCMQIGMLSPGSDPADGLWCPFPPEEAARRAGASPIGRAYRKWSPDPDSYPC